MSKKGNEMRAIIGGKKYDTDTATQVGAANGSVLFKTANGAYFLPRGSDSKILPFADATAARDWSEGNLTTAQIEAAFMVADA